MVFGYRRAKRRRPSAGILLAAGAGLIALLNAGFSGHSFVLCRQAETAAIETLWAGCAGAQAAERICAPVGACLVGPRTLVSHTPQVPPGSGCQADVAPGDPEAALGVPGTACACALDAPCRESSCDDIPVGTSAVPVTGASAPDALSLLCSALDAAVDRAGSARSASLFDSPPGVGGFSLALARTSVLLI